jgi:DNA mismatch repair ATPase MutL
VVNVTDNSADAGATVLRIDAVPTDAPTQLVFTDNGKGMSPTEMHKMLSFGHCEKVYMSK